jgi:hypothetical protein
LPLLILLARRLLYKIHVYLHSVGVAVRTELIAGGIFARIMKSLHSSLYGARTWQYSMVINLFVDWRLVKKNFTYPEVR